MHWSVCVNIAHGQATENTKYVDILETTYLKNNRFHSISSKILSKFSKAMCWGFGRYKSIKKEAKTMISKMDNQKT